VAAPEVMTRLLAHTVDGALREARNKALQELAHILDDLKRQPITYNHYFTDTLQKIQRDKINDAMKKLLDDSKTDVNVNHIGRQTYIDPKILATKMNSHIEQDMDKFAAEQALDTQTAYYKDERKYFVNVITKQVVERHLISSLPKLLMPKMIANLNNEELEYLASEPEEIASRRSHLEGQKDMLRNGQKAFRKALRG
jgi:hypothetical protein